LDTSTSTDIFERFEVFIADLRIEAVTTGMPDDIKYLGRKLWCVGGCILLHEDGRDDG